MEIRWPLAFSLFGPALPSLRMTVRKADFFPMMMWTGEKEKVLFLLELLVFYCYPLLVPQEGMQDYQWPSALHHLLELVVLPKDLNFPYQLFLLSQLETILHLMPRQEMVLYSEWMIQLLLEA